MKLKPILGFCKSEKCVTIQTINENEQWIGNGYSLYLLSKMPTLTTIDILNIMDIPEEKQSEYRLRENSLGKEIFTNDTEEEQEITPEPIQIVANNIILQPFNTATGLLCIDTKYLKPIINNFSTLKFYKRGDFIVIKEGLIFVALIVPKQIVDEIFIKIIEKITQKAKITFENKKK